MGTQVCTQQATKKEGHNVHAQDCELEVGTRILAKDVRDSSQNLGIVVARCGPLSFVVKLNSEQTVRRHVDHLKRLRSIRDDQKEETCMASRLAIETSLPTTPLQDLKAGNRVRIEAMLRQTEGAEKDIQRHTGQALQQQCRHRKQGRRSSH